MFIKWQLESIHDKFKRNHDFITQTCGKKNIQIYFFNADPAPHVFSWGDTGVCHFIAPRKRGGL